MRRVAAVAGLCALVIVIAIQPESERAPYTEPAARERAERILASYLSRAGMQRSDFGSSSVELSNGDALVSFESLSVRGEGVFVTLGRDGTRGLSPYLPSHDFHPNELRR